MFLFQLKLLPQILVLVLVLVEFCIIASFLLLLFILKVLAENLFIFEIFIVLLIQLLRHLVKFIIVTSFLLLLLVLVSIAGSFLLLFYILQALAENLLATIAILGHVLVDASDNLVLQLDLFDFFREKFSLHLQLYFVHIDVFFERGYLLFFEYVLIALPNALRLDRSILFPLYALASLDAVVVVARVTFAGVAVDNSREAMANSVGDLTFENGPNIIL